VDWNQLAHDTVQLTVSFENGEEISGCIKEEEFIDYEV
jgi:hypothetical protein